jgi:GDP-fucose transporter C1
MGFMMSIASLLSIKVTSPITHMVSAAVRGVASSLLGMWLFHDVITSYVFSINSSLIKPHRSLSRGRASSIAIILAGSLYYTWIKHIESAPKVDKDGYESVQMTDADVGRSAQPNDHKV